MFSKYQSPSIYAGHGRCHSKPVRGDHLERQVWSDVDTFLRDPEPVLQQLHAKLEAEAQGSGQFRKQVTRLEGLLAQKAAERSRVVDLFRRGRLTEADLDARMDEIGKEETALEAQIDELRDKIGGADSIGETVSSAEAHLAELRKRLDAPVSWERKRRLIVVSVAGVKQTRTTVTCRLSQLGQPMWNQSKGSQLRATGPSLGAERPSRNCRAANQYAPSLAGDEGNCPRATALQVLTGGAPVMSACL